MGLAAERFVSGPEPTPATGSEASIHPFVRTRRHRVVALLGAAAAVAVLGLGVGALVNSGSEGMDDSAATGTSVERGEDAAAADDKGLRPETADGDELNGEFADAPWEKRVPAERAYVVRSQHLTHDLARIQAEFLPSPATARYGKTLIHAPVGFTCADAPWNRGVLVAVRYDGAPAYVKFRQPMGASQVVEVLQCGTAEVLRSTTLPTNG
ncbi:hypothetical protein F0U44_20635 [Nocardioides humilatus]|uniref:Uncharacterized protein n=1 Tax=Nocardioides humilatus TaxID=2607660 RepID=A0A5B1L4H9_9ACTN|nr:hypothetical protein F0U44_20635 [Nocardioides humilatus]